MMLYEAYISAKLTHKIKLFKVGVYTDLPFFVQGMNSSKQHENEKISWRFIILCEQYTS